MSLYDLEGKNKSSIKYIGGRENGLEGIARVMQEISWGTCDSIGHGAGSFGGELDCKLSRYLCSSVSTSWWPEWFSRKWMQTISLKEVVVV